jgi:hypothetical protein
MINFFIFVFIGSVFLGIFEAWYESKNKVLHTYETLFYNSPEKNMQIKNSTSSRSVFQSLLSNGALVLLVLLAYWLCL